MTKVLGIDPGSTRAAPSGWALVDTDADRVLSFGLLKPNGGEHLADLACQFEDLLLALYRKYTMLDKCAIESAFVGPNVRTGLTLARLVGAYSAIAALSQLPVVEVTPSAAKVAVCGDGKAQKAQVQKAVQMRYDIVVPSHVADSIAVALASVEWQEQGA